MANQIRLKRASGSDPTASDLVLGEPAVRTDTGELFFLKDNGNVAKVSGGGGLSDGDKGDIVVSNSGDTLSIDSGVIDNANIASNAAIAGTKISPDFGSQAITTTGNCTFSDITLENAQPSLILSDNNAESDFALQNRGGVFTVRDIDNNANRFQIASNGTTTVAGDVISTAHITGVSDSTEASFIAKGDGSSQDGYIQLNCSQNSHGIKLKSPPHSASQSYTLTFPSDIQNAKFLTTDANGNLSWGTPTDTNTQLSNSQVRAAVEAASDSNVFTDADHSKLNGIEASATADQTASEIRSLVESASDSNVFTDADHTKLNGIESNATADQTASEILTLIKTVDGAGSGLDSDTVDGIEAYAFLRSDTADTANGDITFSGGGGAVTISGGSDIRFTNGNWTGNSGSTPKIQAHSNYLYIVGGSSGIIFREDGTDRARIDGSGHFRPASDSTYDLGLTGTRWRNVYADAYYGSGANLTNLPSQTDQNFTTALKNKLDGIAASATNVTNNNQLTNGAGYITSAALSGVSDGGNAASLDGIDSSQFLRSDQNDSTTGELTISNSSDQKLVLAGSTSPYILFREGTTNKAFIQWNSSGYVDIANSETSETLRVQSGSDGLKFGVNGTFNKVWHAGNDGAGSGLDADNFDGQASDTFLRHQSDITTQDWNTLIDGTEAGWRTVLNMTGSNRPTGAYTYGTVLSFSKSGQAKFQLYIPERASSSGSNAQNSLWFRSGWNTTYRDWLRILDTNDTGAGNGLDADQLDGQEGSYYLDYNNFTNTPTLSGFPSGTRMIFQQTSAPTGWTKDTSDTNQRALRVVSGTASSGGSVDFTTAFASKGVSGSIANGGNNTNNKTSYSTNNATAGGSVNNHTLNTNRMPQHRHIGGTRCIHDMVNGHYGTIVQGQTRYPSSMYVGGTNGYANYDLHYTNYQGSSHAHNHGFSGSAHSHSMPNHSHSINAHNHSFSGTAINLAVRYLDVIIAQKD